MNNSKNKSDEQSENVEFVNAHELARHCNIRVNSVRQLQKRKVISHSVVGGQNRFHKEECVKKMQEYVFKTIQNGGWLEKK